jgi:hypothetical protein
VPCLRQKPDKPGACRECRRFKSACSNTALPGIQDAVEHGEEEEPDEEEEEVEEEYLLLAAGMAAYMAAAAVVFHRR